MKNIKWLFLAAALSIALSSCVKGDDYGKELEPVLAGINIYQGAGNQNYFSLAPADAGIRLAILLAETAKQSESTGQVIDLNEVTYDGRNVKNVLFGTDTQIEKLNRTGELPYDYCIAYRESAKTPGGYYLQGKIYVDTNDLSTLGQTNELNMWSIVFKELRANIYSPLGVSQVQFSDGVTELYRSGDAYRIVLNNLALRVNEINRDSDWTGAFTLTPETSDLAYSVCMGKQFKFDGSAEGPSFYTYSSNEVATSLQYKLAGGIYRNNGISILGGVETCSLTGYMDYDAALYPAREVTVTTSGSGDNIVRTVSYNGSSVTM